MKEIRLTQGRVTIVDDDTYEYLSQFSWHFMGSGYAARDTSQKDGKKLVLMHREIMHAPDGVVVDHINHDSLDNRKANLRLCTHAQNIQNMKTPRSNTSGYKGVYLNKASRKWQAYIRKNGVFYHLGLFSTAEEAAHTYDKKARELFGEFANTNFK